MNKSLSFIESKKELAEALRILDENKDGLQIILVTPESVYEAEKRNMYFPTIDDFFSKEEMNVCGDENIRIAENLLSDLDEILHSSGIKIKNNELVSFKAFFHYVKSFLDCISYRTLPVFKIFNRFQPSTLICPELSPYKVKSVYHFHKPVHSLTNHIAYLLAKTKGCEIRFIKCAEATPDDLSAIFPPSEKQQIRKGLYLHKAIPLIRYLKNLAKNGLYKPKKSGCNGPLLMTSVFEDLGNEIQKEWDKFGTSMNLSSFYAPAAIEKDFYCAQKKISELWEKVRLNSSFKRYFIYNDVDLFTIAEDFFRHLFFTETADLLACSSVLDSELKKIKNKKRIILTGGIVGRNHLLAKYASNLKIPFVSYHYGGFLGYSYLPIHERFDLAEVDYFICGGHGSAKTFRHPSPWTFWNDEVKRAEPVATGLPWIEQLIKNEREVSNKEKKNTNKKYTVMYVASALVGDNHYLGYVYPSDIWQWRLQKKMIETVKEFPSVHFLFKAPLRARYPQPENPIFDHIKDINTDNIEVMPDIPLKEVLDEADLFILDSPSTPLLHVLATTKPFILYADSQIFKFIPEAAIELRKRGIFCGNEDDFFKAFKEQLTICPGDNDLVNDDFLKAYATHLQDGDSSKRIVQFLYKIVNDNSN